MYAKKRALNRKKQCNIGSVIRDLFSIRASETKRKITGAGGKQKNWTPKRFKMKKLGRIEKTEDENQHLRGKKGERETDKNEKRSR